ncbi:MAG: sigma-54-dependent Fis family transcriptional regulator [Desulfobulbaceae bacterium]|nr:sigma-54-dependent Fis family transcriptional regulator [Desulfobulbaceae bacterium]
MPPVKEARILIVDADESIRFTFEQFLIKAGYGPVVSVATAAGALAAVKNDSYDLVICDILLEDIKGPELLKQLRNAGVDCPVVMITGAPDIDTAAEIIRLGVFDYIKKPINKQLLLHFTGQALRHRLLQKEKKILESENEKYRHYLEAVFRSVQDALITVDYNLEIIELNDKARKWIQEFSDEIPEVPKNLGDLRGEFGSSCLIDARQVISTRTEVKAHIIEYERPGGRKRIISLNAAPIFDDHGTFSGVVLVARDITASGITPESEIFGTFHGFVDNSPAMLEVFRLIQNVGKVDTTVLITGESGTGKELTAEALHEESPRRDGPLVKVDCASIPEELLESELFGHKKGAFTGADRDRTGRIMQADGGTLFLDEIGDISSRLQLRLLRFLQERTFNPVGQDTPVKVDVRVITATNADLKDKVNKGIFREDLYYRLRVVEINLPPLRARRESIPLLVNHFVAKFSASLDRGIDGISDQAMTALINYSWPGNVRELQHTIERACVLCQGPTLTLDYLPDELQRKEFRTVKPAPSSQESTLSVPGKQTGSGTQADLSAADPHAEEIEEILDALQRAENNKAKAARLLGIDRSTLYRRMVRLKLQNVAK